MRTLFRTKEMLTTPLCQKNFGQLTEFAFFLLFSARPLIGRRWLADISYILGRAAAYQKHIVLKQNYHSPTSYAIFWMSQVYRETFYALVSTHEHRCILLIFCTMMSHMLVHNIYSACWRDLRNDHENDDPISYAIKIFLCQYYRVYFNVVFYRTPFIGRRWLADISRILGGAAGY